MSGLKQLFEALLKKGVKQHKLDENNIEELFNELEEIQIKKKRIHYYFEELNQKEEAHQQYKNLDPDAVSKINVLAQQAKDIEERKQNLKGRLISNNAALNRLAKYEDEIPDLIKEMQIAEKRRRETESHILYLKEERIDLEEEREALLRGYRFLQGFSLVMVVLLGVCLLVSFTMLQILKQRIWTILSVIVIITLAYVVGVVLAKEKMEKEIKNNGILQQKAVKYLNKSKIRFFNQTQYLLFQYHKLGVDSVAKLELYYNRYLKNKNNEKVYLQMNEKLSEIEEDILHILHEKNILLEDIGDLADWILQPKKLNEINMIQEDREKTQEQLQALQIYEEELWKEINVLAEDVTYQSLIEEKIAYFKEENMLDKTLQDA